MKYTKISHDERTIKRGVTIYITTSFTVVSGKLRNLLLFIFLIIEIL